MTKWLLKNPHSGSAERIEALGPTIERAGIRVLSPETPAELHRILREARLDCERLLIAGGDGTVHRVVNAMRGDFQRPPLALIPLGTGNDLARTLGIPFDPAEALELACTGAPRPLDLLQVDTGGEPLFCVNVCAGGFSGDVTEAVGNRTKQAWGPLAYLRGAADSVADMPGYEVTLRYTSGSEERLTVLNLIIANGRTAGAGSPWRPQPTRGTACWRRWP
ncbi:diacylglycerol/lipid kinase family protein [Thiohalorhabdus methylotrophus]|uniref:Diacylglycerol kinase family protein n=1 Tax=Thiohalorhabdus methylotrophus TaxID=3242694 RepID=A0ABV4TXV5_9GAMM